MELSSEDLSMSKHVDVGWGKAETQFRGKGAKAQAQAKGKGKGGMRDPTVPERVEEGVRSEGDDWGATISWRGDGACLGVNSLVEGDGRRVVRVFSREGVLEGVSEPVDWLEGGLSWRPSGNVMAGVRREQEEGRVEVVFFERNGLRHGGFELRLGREEMDTWGRKIGVQWNVDSSVLAVCFLDRVQLWTMGNYHYYLKQEVRFPGDAVGQDLPYFAWHPEQPLLFAVGLMGSVHKYQYGYRVASGSVVPPHDYGMVSVIDGTVLKITPLRISNVPPPMALAEVSVESNIVDVCYFNADSAGRPSVMIAALHQKGVSMFEWDLHGKASNVPLLASHSKAPWLGDLSDLETALQLPRQLAFLDSRTILILTSDGEGSQLTRLALKGDEISMISTELVSHVTELISISTNSHSTTCLRTGSQLAPIANSTSNELERKITGYPTNPEHQGIKSVSDRAESIALAQLNNGVDGDTLSKHVIFSLERNGTLNANKRSIARGCTSFLVTTSHLIFTTSQHLLKFVHLADAEDLEIPADTPEEDERCRSIERGAKLVTVIPSTSALVLQMPRGNLETIYPRALILPLIRKSINDSKYKKAFLACRNHRVDMNILYDHAPEKFLQNVGLFIDQIQKVEHIDLFLSQLREEDVSKTMYKDTVPKNDSQMDKQEPRSLSDKAQKGDSKINSICDAFLQSLSSRTSTNLQNAITAHVCKSPPDLEAGLLEVASICKESPENGEKAVEHICFLADVNRLYDTALGLYDLDLTLQIAQQSQRDPREYVPFLQKLKDKESLWMKVDVDNHLGRFGKVLTHLQDLNDFEGFQTHVVKHSLYEEALALYRYQENRIKDIMQSYAEYLKKQSRNQDAGIAYEYLLDYEAASESYRLAHLWQEALTCGSLVPFDESRMRTFALSIAESQSELKEYRAAATVTLDYLDDIEEATRLFCKGYHFADATRLVSHRKRPDLLQSIIDTGLAEGQAAMTEMLAECKGQLDAQVPRIRELRIKKTEEPLAFYDADMNGGADVPDNISLAGTDASTAGGTLFTRYTNRTGTIGTSATRRTSKKRRQEERKRARGKKGSVYEEEYLVNSIARLIERVNSIGDEVERLVMGLMRRGMRERARAVETAMASVVDLCKEHAPEVFLIPKKQPAEVKEEMSEYRPTGGDAVFLDSMEEIQTPKEPPVIKDFKKLSILGK